MTTTSPERGEVWWVRFDPAVGSEQRKVRPAVVVSRNEIGRLPLRIVVPVTDWKPGYASYPWFVELQPSPDNGLGKRSGADGFQVKSVSLERFQDRLGVLGAAEMEDIAAAIALCVGAS